MAQQFDGPVTVNGKVEIFAQDGLAVTGFQPFVSLSDTNAGNATGRIQCVDGGIGLDANNAPPVFIQAKTGNVGIGTTKPSSKVEIFAQDGLAVTGFQPFISLRDTNAGNATGRIQCVDGGIGLDANNAPPVFIQAKTGNVGIGTTAPEARLHVVGDINAVVIKVRGDIQLSNGDCAEDFDIADAQVFEPGTVMVVGEAGALQQSQNAYDKRVVGVVSGAGEYRPALILDKQPRPDRQPIALLGKVSCKVDADQGGIEIGDLLTTSVTPGHAMKADDLIRAFGSVIGKALQPLAKGRGQIPILIALQ
jgi:hypothetical protein